MTPIAVLQAAAMPSLYTAKPSSPQIHVLHQAPGHALITPDQLRASNPKIIATGAGTQLAKLSPGLLVKYGTHASLIEAKTMLYVAEHTSVPVPRLFAAYAFGPLDRDVGDFGSVYDTYLFMEYIEGEDLGKSWGKCTSTEKQTISTDLKRHLLELRSLPAGGYIGSVHDGPVTDGILEWSTTCKGPFINESHFNATLADTFLANSKSPTRSYIRDTLDAHHHATVFTHGDLRPDNVIVRDGRVAAIVDWEMGGWYPAYWEFVKAVHSERFDGEWAAGVLGFLEPWFCEDLVFEKLMGVLW